MVVGQREEDRPLGGPAPVAAAGRLGRRRARDPGRRLVEEGDGDRLAGQGEELAEGGHGTPRGWHRSAAHAAAVRRYAGAVDGVIEVDDPRAEDVRALLAAHLAFAREHSPPEDVHALDVGGLVDPVVTFYSYREAGRLLAITALRHLDAGHAEVKSMHTASAARGRGIGRAMIAHLVAEARARGYRRLSLETGTMAAFAPARALYAAAGFVPCAPFAGYRQGPNSTCMTMWLQDG